MGETGGNPESRGSRLRNQGQNGRDYAKWFGPGKKRADIVRAMVMHTLLVVAIGFAVVVGLGFALLGFGAKHAPDGYEDESGFHFGREPDGADEDFLIPPIVECRDDRRDGAVIAAKGKRPGARAARPSVGLR